MYTQEEIFETFKNGNEVHPIVNRQTQETEINPTTTPASSKSQINLTL